MIRDFFVRQPCIEKFKHIRANPFQMNKLFHFQRDDVSTCFLLLFHLQLIFISRGELCNSNAIANNDSCVCAQGYFGNGTECEPCRMGTYQSGYGRLTNTSCQACESGKFQSGTGMAFEDNCTSCEAGKYQTGTGIGTSEHCIFCASGAYSTGLGMSSELNCSMCGAGTFSTGSGMQIESQCVSCAAG